MVVAGTASRLNALIKRHPLLSSVCAAAVNGCCADAYTQIAIEKSNTLNFERTRLFALFGACLHGLSDYVFINHVYFWLFPGHSWKCHLKKVAVDGLILAPLEYFPIFYYFRRGMHNGQWKLDSETIREVSVDWKQNVRQDMLAVLGVWSPALFVTLAYVPMHLRVPFLQLIDFAWMCGMSRFRGRINEDDDRDQGIMIIQSDLTLSPNNNNTSQFENNTVPLSSSLDNSDGSVIPNHENSPSK